MRTNAWDHQLTSAEEAEAAPLLGKIDELLGSMTGVHLIATFVKMRVWPLRARAHLMWAYEGVQDSSRMSTEELSKNELVAHVRSITSLRSSDPCNVDCPVTPYGAEKPLEEVSERSSLLSTGFAILLYIFVTFDYCIWYAGPFDCVNPSSSS